MRVLPAGAVTGIGSLPHTSAESAILAVAELSPEIPFWPQLPQFSERERAIGQCLGLLDGLIEPRESGYGYQVKSGAIDKVVGILHRSGGELPATHAAGFAALERVHFASAIAVKGQIEGPITLATYLFHNGRPFLADSALFAAVAFHISQIVCWQIERLQRAGLPVLMFIDEPALCLESAGVKLIPEAQRLSALAATIDGARARGALAGLHCCAERPFARMFQVSPDILSFDAHEGLDLFFADADAVRFVRDGGAVAYGMVPTLRNLDGLHPVALFNRWLRAASFAGDPQELAQHAMITATCGLGLLDISAAEDSFRLANGLGKLIRGFAGG